MKKIISILVILFNFNSFSQDLWTLQECVNRALNENISIKQAELDYLDSEISRKTAIEFPSKPQYRQFTFLEHRIKSKYNNRIIRKCYHSI